MVAVEQAVAVVAAAELVLQQGAQGALEQPAPLVVLAF
jgi:hypothetical protein